MRKVLIALTILTLATPSTALAKGSAASAPKSIKASKVRLAARSTARGVGFVDKDCKDFVTQPKAQEFYLKAGGPALDPHDLDRDHDGIACEALRQ